MPPQMLAAVSPELEKLMNGGSLERRYSDVVEFRVVLKYLTVVNACASVEAFLYGIHCILFAICCFILAKKRDTASIVFLVAAIIMFGLSTADFALTLRMQLADIPKFLQGKMSLDGVIKRGVAKGQLFVSNNLIADLLLLYRCSKVWRFHRSVLATSVLLLLADTVWGWVGAGNSRAYLTSWGKFTVAYYSSIFCVNVIMTILIVGRLWWITKSARPRPGSRDLRLFQAATVVFAETAFIYSACVLLAIVFPRQNPYFGLVSVVAIRVVSIMPTLLIVQITGGRSFDERFKKSTAEDIGRSDIPQGTSVALDTMITTRGSAGNIEAEEVPLEEDKPNDAGA